MHFMTFQDMNEVTFDKFLKFIYTGREEAIGDDIAEMLRMAAIFQVNSVKYKFLFIPVNQLFILCKALRVFLLVLCILGCPSSVINFLQTTSKPQGGISPNFTGMILGWFPFKVMK